jgi:hypothetical protein
MQTLYPFFGNSPADATEENLQARARGTLLMGLSNKFGNLVLSTGNKSELAVGYCTLYGDMVDVAGSGGCEILQAQLDLMFRRRVEIKLEVVGVLPKQELAVTGVHLSIIKKLRNATSPE